LLISNIIYIYLKKPFIFVKPQFRFNPRMSPRVIQKILAKHRCLHVSHKLLSDNESLNSSESNISSQNGSASPENGPIDSGSSEIDRTKFIANTFGRDREAIEEYFDTKKAAIRLAFADDLDMRNALLDQLESQELDVKDTVGLTLEPLSPGFAPNSDTSSESEIPATFVQDSSDVVGGEEPMEFGDD
jgi:hypothetical protein